MINQTNEYDRMTNRANQMGVDLQLTSMSQNGHEDVVLGFWRGEYVTWNYCNGGFHCGHYYADYNEAKTDFFKRAAK